MASHNVKGKIDMATSKRNAGRPISNPDTGRARLARLTAGASKANAKVRECREQLMAEGVLFHVHTGMTQIDPEKIVYERKKNEWIWSDEQIPASAITVKGYGLETCIHEIKQSSKGKYPAIAS